MPLQEQITSVIIPELTKELNLKNTMAVPRPRFVKLNVGIGSLTKRTKDFSDIINNITLISGQKPVVTHAKMAISNFKLRVGMPTGITVTLRGRKMYDFLDRLVNIVFPRVRDFRGLSTKSFDGNGNFSVGLKEAIVFPEINPDDVLNVHGLQITVATTASNNEEGIALLKKIGFPFQKDQ